MSTVTPDRPSITPTEAPPPAAAVVRPALPVRPLPPTRSPSTATWVAVGMLAAAFIGLYFRWFWKQHEHSAEKMEDWGHAYIIPVISGYLIWQVRGQLRAEPVRTFWPGLVPLLLGIVCYLFFVVGVANHMLQGVSMILALAGLTLLLAGPGVFRYLFLPIAYLVFSITLSEQIMIKVTFQLQLMASKGAYVFLTILGAIFGFGVDLSGNTLSIAGNKMNVAEACSGMRMVVAFYALAGAVALLSCKHWWQRIALMLLAGPVAILMNVVRVTVLGLLSLNNINFASGDAHMLIGTLLLIPSLALFLGVVWALNRIMVEPVAAGAAKKGQAAKAPVLAPVIAPSGRPLFRRGAYIAALSVLMLSSVGMSAAISYFKLYLRKEKIYAADGRQVSAIPTESESFVRIGSDTRMPPEIEEVLGTPNYVSRVYVEKNPPQGKERRALQFHGAYYTGMVDTVPHVPDRCMVGAGMQLKGVVGDIPLPLDVSKWREDDTVPQHLIGHIFEAKTALNPDNHTKYSDAELTYFRLPRDPKDIKLRVTHFEDDTGRPIYAGYFFIANGGVVSRAEGVRLLAFDLKSTYSYYLKVEFQSQSVASAEELAELAAKWLNENFAEVMRCVPDWVKVESGEYPPDNPMRVKDAPPNAADAEKTN